MKRYLVILGVLALLAVFALPVHAHISVSVPESNSGGVIPPGTR